MFGRAILIFTLSIFSWELNGKIIPFGKKEISLSVRSGGPTLLRFPVPVQTISGAKKFRIFPTDKNNPDYRQLSLEPRLIRGKDTVVFVLADGTIFQTTIRVSPKAGPPILEFKSRKKHLSHKSKPRKESPPMDLMRAMIGGKRLPGYKIKDSDIEVSLGNPDIEAQITKIYEGKYTGYVLKLKNNSWGKKWLLRIPELSLGNSHSILLAHSNIELLSHRRSKTNETLLHIVGGDDTSPDELVLPFDEIERKER